MIADHQFERVHPIRGEWLRYRVESERTQSRMYLVDLGALPVGKRFNGKCECEDFTIRRAVKLKETKQIGNKTRCKHIKLAMWYFCEFMMGAMFEQQQKERQIER